MENSIVFFGHGCRLNIHKIVANPLKCYQYSKEVFFRQFLGNIIGPEGPLRVVLIL